MIPASDLSQVPLYYIDGTYFILDEHSVLVIKQRRRRALAQSHRRFTMGYLQRQH